MPLKAIQNQTIDASQSRRSRQALRGRFTGHLALLLSHILSHLDYLEEAIGELSQEIERRLAPFQHELELLRSIPRVERRTAEAMLAELGPDMARFPSHRHAASWAGICPGSEESAGKRRSGRTRKGNRWLREVLIESGLAASRSKDTYLRAHYGRVKRHRGHKRATVSTGHSILVSAYHVLKQGVPYHELGGDHFTRRDDPERLVQRLVRPARTARATRHPGASSRNLTPTDFPISPH